MRAAHTLTRTSLLLVVLASAACVGEMPPPPELRVTSPDRGLVQDGSTRVTVEGNVRPGPSGSPVTRVEVNDIRATIAADGSFSATIDVEGGATLLETTAFSEEGGAATDARVVHAGELRPVGSNIERAVTASLSAEAFALLSAEAGPFLMSANLPAMLPPGPIASFGDDTAHMAVSIARLSFGDVRISLTPIDGGLQFSAQIDALDFGGNAAYGGDLAPEGNTMVGATADRITIAGTLVVTPNGNQGFSVKVASPNVDTDNLRLQASGLVGTILNLLNNNLGSAVTDITTKAAEAGLTPMINAAFGALAGVQQFDVLGHHLALEASPAAVAFTREGAQVTLNLATTIGGSESSRGYIFTPNGMPSMDMADGVQVGLADDLVNELLAEVHAIGLLDIHLEDDFVVFDTVDLSLTVPPMISANTEDGLMRLVLGDMIASFSDGGTEIVRAAVNAQVDLQVLRGEEAEQIALEFGKARVFVNMLDTTNPGDPGADGYDLGDAAAAGIALQLDSMSQFVIKVPVPSVAGVTLDSLALRADAGYVVMSGEIH
jgi:hypothetical protein